MEKTRTICLESKVSSISELEQFIEEVCEAYDVRNAYLGHIVIAITEAFENARLHGNKEDLTKKVILGFNAVRKGSEFSIKDEGDGFDFKTLPDPMNDDSAGRGIFLIDQLADEVSWKDGGRKIVILFKTTSMNFEVAMMRIRLLKEYLGKHKFVHN